MIAYVIVADSLHVDAQILLRSAQPVAAVALRFAQIRVRKGSRVGRGSRARSGSRCRALVTSGRGQCPLVRAAAARLRGGRRRRCRLTLGQIVEAGTFGEYEVEVFRVLKLVENVRDFWGALVGRVHLLLPVLLGLHNADAGVQRAVRVLLGGFGGVRVELSTGTAESALVALSSGGEI